MVMWTILGETRVVVHTVAKMFYLCSVGCVHGLVRVEAETASFGAVVS